MKKRIPFILMIVLCGCNSSITNNSVTSNKEIASEPIALDSNTSESSNDVSDFPSEKSTVSYNIPECEPFGDTIMDGVIYYKANPTMYQMTAPISVSFEDCVTTNSEKEGYKDIELKVHYNVKGIYTSDCMDYSSVILPMTELCDINTGVIFTAEEIKGSDGYSFSGTLKMDTKDVAIFYQCEASFAEDDWIKADEGFTKNLYFDVIYSVTIPNEYDSLGLKMSPTDSYDEYLRMRDNEDYKNIKDYSPEGTKLFKL